MPQTYKCNHISLKQWRGRQCLFTTLKIAAPMALAQTCRPASLSDLLGFLDHFLMPQFSWSRGVSQNSEGSLKLHKSLQ